MPNQALDGTPTAILEQRLAILQSEYLAALGKKPFEETKELMAKIQELLSEIENRKKT